MSTTSPSFVSSTNFLMMKCAASSRSWMKMENLFHLGYTSCYRIPVGLCATDNTHFKLSSSASFHSTSCSLICPYFISLSVRMMQKVMWKTLLKSRWTTPTAVSFSCHLDSKWLNWIPGYAKYFWSCQDSYLRKFKYFGVVGQKSILQVIWIA